MIERLVAAVVVVARTARRWSAHRCAVSSANRRSRRVGLPAEGRHIDECAGLGPPTCLPRAGHRALVRIVEQLACLRAVGLNSAGAEAAPSRTKLPKTWPAKVEGLLPSICVHYRHFAATRPLVATVPGHLGQADR